MDLQELITQARDAMSAKLVFGEPVEEQGVTIIPAASIRGGGGGGKGPGPEGESLEGTGGGFGLAAKPAGAYVVKDGEASWRPALDVNRVILGGQAVAVAALLTVRSIVKARSGRRRGPQPRLALRRLRRR